MTNAEGFIGAGQGSFCFNLSPIDDLIVEDSETFFILLELEGQTINNVTLTIADNDSKHWLLLL